LPYVQCEQCRLRSYTAALHARVDECPRCGASLDAHASLPERFAVLTHGTKRPSLFIRWVPEERPQPSP